MCTPTVTENIAKLEPVTRDEFIQSTVPAIVGPQDRPVHRFVPAAPHER
jgi:hypothetical protein